MPPIHADDRLDDFSRFALKRILACFPAWEPLVTIVKSTYRRGSYVDINVPCPSPTITRGLDVSTQNLEITVGLHNHHTHFGDHEGDDPLTRVTKGTSMISEILEDRIGVVASDYEGHWSGFFFCNRGDVASVLDLHESLGRIRWLTWSGSHDFEIARKGVR